MWVVCRSVPVPVPAMLRSRIIVMWLVLRAEKLCGYVHFPFLDSELKQDPEPQVLDPEPLVKCFMF
jgi:hypothetical protein